MLSTKVIKTISLKLQLLNLNLLNLKIHVINDINSLSIYNKDRFNSKYKKMLVLAL